MVAETAKSMGCVLVCLCLCGLLLAVQARAQEDVLFRDDFDDLSGWEPFSFRNIDRHSRYRVVNRGENSVLEATSDASASALISRQRFSVSQYPVLQWRWQVTRLYEKGNYLRKDGDDYPLRVYVIFEYDPENADFGTRISYELARTWYGDYPPHSSINYIWANRSEEREPVANPFTDRAIMIPLRSGPEYVGRWVEETVDVLADYQRLFGEPPPATASLAIMNDADNTGEAAISYIDYIEVRSRSSSLPVP
ncbi:DUF3047 domain-containing protein [Desulfofustis limnaeus]|jgi:hypothetical protein|uniref:DUF3047 domain-containing protein n=1 Tax=Desulfofustis limnaeus TaxID=2740163 RepID=A0ABN6M9F4_9BACT|nr:DUF3047 domain-containing protein [Desulfofustis limnaeus]MDX9895512.1 DUF3047 domain-containing protein [Desulfofustis sp.]BDD88401.1 hypothetical protein DPPLL_27660 [Desulfofustis limnaeus]